jgi:predicted nucleotidyltransferase
MNRQKRFEVAKEFISQLQTPPLSWHVSGSTARGDFRPNSDLDITALWERDEDIPLPSEENNFLFPFGGYKIDLHSFAKEWLVFKLNPDLLGKIFPDLKEEA